MPLLRAEALSRTLDGDVPVHLIRDAQIHIDAGEFVAITGPSGSGKSSLLYLLGLLDRPSGGELWLDNIATSSLADDALAALRLSRIGFVFQFHFLLPEFSIIDNVIMPARRLGVLSDMAMRQRAEQLLAELGLEGQGKKYPRQLSGGQSQRVAIARALMNQPDIILADEPTGNLDSKSSHMVQDILQSLSARGCTVLVVTHDHEFAGRASRQIHLIDGRISDN